MKILNKHHNNVSYVNTVNIMRPSMLGNPFMIGRHGDRQKVVAMHMIYARERIAQDPEFKAAVKALNGKNLVCCCAPLQCHGDNLVILCEELNR